MHVREFHPSASLCAVAESWRRQLSWLGSLQDVGGAWGCLQGQFKQTCFPAGCAGSQRRRTGGSRLLQPLAVKLLQRGHGSSRSHPQRLAPCADCSFWPVQAALCPPPALRLPGEEDVHKVLLGCTGAESGGAVVPDHLLLSGNAFCFSWFYWWQLPFWWLSLRWRSTTTSPPSKG